MPLPEDDFSLTENELRGELARLRHSPFADPGHRFYDPEEINVPTQCACPSIDGSEGVNPHCPVHGMYRTGGGPGPNQQATVTRVRRTRDEILEEAARLISGDREDTYGSAIADFTRTGKMWAAILGVPEVTAEQVALCMAAVKIGRLCHTPNHPDSWVDACGYLALGGDIAATPDRYI